MNRVEKIAEQIRNLSRVELEEFRAWYAEFEAQAPDTDGAWLKEAEDRLAAHRVGDLAAIDVEQVFGELADTDEKPDWLDTSQRRYRELVDGQTQGVCGPLVFEKLRAGDRLARLNDDLRRLPLDERIRLVEDLWDSIAADQNLLPLTPEQRAEFDRCLDAHEASGRQSRPAEDVIAEIKKKL